MTPLFVCAVSQWEGDTGPSLPHLTRCLCRTCSLPSHQLGQSPQPLPSLEHLSRSLAPVAVGGVSK